jgi:tetratricopeptide (TPR) repeat protein
MLMVVLCSPVFGQKTATDWFEAFDKVIEINPQLIMNWEGNCIVLNAQGRYDEAVQAFEKAIEINPQDVDAWLDKSHVLYNQSKYDEALQAYNKAIEINPRYSVFDKPGTAEYKD